MASLHHAWQQAGTDHVATNATITAKPRQQSRMQQQQYNEGTKALSKCHVFRAVIVTRTVWTMVEVFLGRGRSNRFLKAQADHDVTHLARRPNSPWEHDRFKSQGAAFVGG